MHYSKQTCTFFVEAMVKWLVLMHVKRVNYSSCFVLEAAFLVLFSIFFHFLLFSILGTII